ncbi:hypothetical protein GGS20DRAFT_206693 [Poronia punctata]|nr:hypothetical protein GGS20DRAFT_206693 [Poronia punctata]
MDGDKHRNGDASGGNGAANGDGDGERGRERESDTNNDFHVSHENHAQHHQPQQPHARSKHPKRVVAGGAGRFHARVPSTKALHAKQLPQLATKLNRRAVSPDPEPSPMLAHTHRRAASELKLTQADSHVSHNTAHNTPHNPAHHSSHTISRNTSHTNLATKRNRSHVEVGKRPKTTTNIKRSSSHKDVHKLKGAKNQVHFDLGLEPDHDDETNEDEWVDASASASPYLSRRGSVMSGGQSPAKPPSPKEKKDENNSRPQTPGTDARPADRRDTSPALQTVQHNNYITSRLLQRTASNGAPPQTSTETATVLPSGSPGSQASHGPPSLYGTPKTSTLGASGSGELISRFVNGSGPSSGGHGDGDYFVTPHAQVRAGEGIRPSRSLGNLHNAARRGSVSEEEEEDVSALLPRSRRSSRALPASQSRTQQKLNLQRASSSIEPAQSGQGSGVIGASLLVGNTDYETRDPRIPRLLERTGMEYLVVRRYQNPIARSIDRLSQLRTVDKNQSIPKVGAGNMRPRDSMELAATGQLGPNPNMPTATRSRPATPRRAPSTRTVGARSYDGHEDRFNDRVSGSSYVEGNDEGLTSLLRSIWEKNTDLGSSQD